MMKLTKSQKKQLLKLRKTDDFNQMETAFIKQQLRKYPELWDKIDVDNIGEGEIFIRAKSNKVRYLYLLGHSLMADEIDIEYIEWVRIWFD